MILIGIINSFSCPTFVTMAIIGLKNSAYEELPDDIKECCWYLLYLQVSQTVMIFFVTFVPYNIVRQFESWITYNDYMRYVHYYATFGIFYIFPPLYILLNIYALFATELSSTWLGAYFALFSFISFPLLFWYDNTIRQICDELKNQSKVSIQLDREEFERLKVYQLEE